MAIGALALILAVPTALAAPAVDLGAPVPKVAGRLRASDIGLVINRNDPYSVAIGAYYASRRGLRRDQVLRVDLPVKAVISAAEFEVLRAEIRRRFGARTQALALAWTQPYAVECNSITGALALGFDASLCAHSCAPSRVSAYANARTARPYRDLGLRPSMLLAARSVADGRALIDRGVASDGTLGRRGGLPVVAAYVSTSDAARNVRARLYPLPGESTAAGLRIERVNGLAPLADEPLLLVQTGAAQLQLPERMRWMPGALADHLTSFGGQLLQGHGQSTALDWLAAGATASHGTVSEPCNHLQKFPHPQWLLLHYLQGSTAIEAYWKSVLWPQQSLFVGEPLAAPFAKR